MAKKGKPNNLVEIHFEKQDLKYSDEEWLTSASDVHGHSIHEQYRCPPQMASEVGVAVTHYALLCGYESKSDLIRHAILRHLEFLRRIEPTMRRTYSGAIAAQNLVITEDRHKAETEGIFVLIRQRIDSHLDRGDYGEAVRLVSELKRTLDGVVDTPWRRRWLDLYRRDYAQYLNPSFVPPAPAEQKEAPPAVQPIRAMAPAVDEDESTD